MGIFKKAIWPSGKAVDCKSSIPSSNLGVALRGYGGMVDTTDLKSVDLNSRVGSSPTTPNGKKTYFYKKVGNIVQIYL